MLERRKHARHRSFASGTVVGAEDRSPLACVIRDQSESGALLLLDDPRRAPAELELSGCGDVRPVRVVWRSETGVGIAFVGAVPAPESRPASVICLDAARRARGSDDEGRLAERIARFVRPARRLAAD